MKRDTDLLPHQLVTQTEAIAASLPIYGDNFGIQVPVLRPVLSRLTKDDIIRWLRWFEGPLGPAQGGDPSLRLQFGRGRDPEGILDGHLNGAKELALLIN